MDIKEKSREYAEGKAVEAISAAIEKAYFDGYNDGLKHYENERLESFVDGVEYKDLMLESGTMWAAGYVRDNGLIGLFSYIEASKFNLPTKEDFEELCRDCAIDNYLYTNNHGIKFSGKNGEKIELPFIKVDGITSDLGMPQYIAFWLKDEGDNPQKMYARVNDQKKIIDSQVFMGYKLPVLLVRKVKK